MKTFLRVFSYLAQLSNRPTMAREFYTPEDLQALAKELVSAAETIESIATHMHSVGMPKALIHGTTLKTVYLPQLLNWIDKARADTQAQARAYSAGVPSKAEVLKQVNQKLKLAAAKKAVKAPKKKA